MSDRPREERPGSDGEKELQERFDSKERALQFYEDSMHDHLTQVMCEFVEERIMFFLATADADGNTDCSPRVGPRGFVTVLDDERLVYPEYRGNGVNASLGNMVENSHATLVFVDWWESTVGLHVNGQTSIREDVPGVESSVDATKAWVEVEVEEAYIHCSKHIPKLSIEEFSPPWGTDDPTAKSSGFFAKEE